MAPDLGLRITMSELKTLTAKWREDGSPYLADAANELEAALRPSAVEAAPGVDDDVYRIEHLDIDHVRLTPALAAAPGMDWRELASEAVYVGLCIGHDCAAKLAELQESGVYRPRCDDGKPSNANARKDADKIADIYRRGLAILRANPEASTPAAAPAPVDGMVLVPQKMYVEPESWEAAQFAFGGPGAGEGESYMPCTLWVGEIEGDDGEKTYGLHVSCDECPEEGSITLAEFPAPTSAPTPDRATPGEQKQFAIVLGGIERRFQAELSATERRVLDAAIRQLTQPIASSEAAHGEQVKRFVPAMYCEAGRTHYYPVMNPAPNGGWVRYEDYAAYRQPAAAPGAVDADELLRATCGIAVVGQIDGHDVIRRLSAIDLIRRRLTAALATKPDGPRAGGEDRS